ncbi:MAG TPA: permease-like cell division protein FtsX [Balneolaceae bacterium]|nr:permease-like cell division protein FtsX [Balneolaceae bacterium]
MSVNYIIREGLAGFKRARLASLTSIFSLFIAVFLLGVLARISFNAFKVAGSLKQSVDVEVFLDDINDELQAHIQNKLQGQELVQQVSYISKDSAAAVFKEEFGTAGASLAELNFLPASFRVKMKTDASVNQVDSLVQVFEQYSGVDEVSFNQKLLEIIETRFHTVTTVGGILGGLILLAALILVFNTIRLTIYAKRKLIKAMKLVGATNAFIRRPFVVEGVFQGLIAGVLAVIVMILSFQFLLTNFIPAIGILDWPYEKWYYLSGAMLGLAVLMGFLGSQWASRRFIKKTSVNE